ncbi:unnamed protein product [Paramecium octaurelia]|uniref:Uncharacterized protein n=1 Tax=Paramecium octaurelia TaxID=43137 RepID=A0A8S1U2K9_PAROT|nr:unnamed protein product [Paramecium octaurelia]
MYESRNNSVPRSLQQLQYLKQYHIMDITNDQQQIANYLDVLNQETDVYYLFDSFHSLLNSVKQAEEAKITNKPRQNTIDWWKLTNQSYSWAGLKNIKGISNTPSKIRVTNDSSHARQIGQVELQVFSEKDLEPNKQDRTLLSVYQLQNKYYKCHMGFCQLQKLEGQVVIINKLYIAKWYRKVGNYLELIQEFIKYILNVLSAQRVKIKINSSQGSQIKYLQQLGFKLSQTIPLINDLKIFTLILDKQ